jgi:carbonic anhydrase
LHTPLIVVLGHESCGAVAAALEHKPLAGDLGWLVKQVYVGDRLPEDKAQRLTAAIRANVLHAAAELTHQSNTIHELKAAKRVEIVTGIYSLASGKVEWIEKPNTKAQKESK